MENLNQPPQTQITVADLDALRNIVDVAAARGAFRATELTQIGAVYDKLTTFLNAVTAKAEADAKAAAEPTTDSDEVDASSES